MLVVKIMCCLFTVGIFDETTNHLKPVFTSAILAANDLQETDTIAGTQLELSGTDYKKSENGNFVSF